jgi:Uma2 family endonuclease
MATMISPTTQPILLEGVSWATYECLLADFGDSHAARVAYDRGTLEIMSPSYVHEQLNSLIAMLVSVVATEMDIDFENAGSTTFKRADVGRGFEPDSCFYLQHVAAIRGKRTIDLATDPPPDLVVEIDITHPSLDKMPIYATLGVPEVWRATEERVVVYQRMRDGYAVVDQSTVLPGLAAAELQDWLAVSEQTSRAAWMKQIQSWARDRWGRASL